MSKRNTKTAAAGSVTEVTEKNANDIATKALAQKVAMRSIVEGLTDAENGMATARKGTALVAVGIYVRMQTDITARINYRLGAKERRKSIDAFNSEVARIIGADLADLKKSSAKRTTLEFAGQIAHYFTKTRALANVDGRYLNDANAFFVTPKKLQGDASDVARLQKGGLPVMAATVDQMKKIARAFLIGEASGGKSDELKAVERLLALVGIGNDAKDENELDQSPVFWNQLNTLATRINTLASQHADAVKAKASKAKAAA